jgi:hypothetical protein
MNSQQSFLNKLKAMKYRLTMDTEAEMKSSSEVQQAKEVLRHKDRERILAKLYEIIKYN